ncbi:non-ribosomal peptide synthetase [Mycobacterium sp. 141]|uniref:non-ribosomal peptide synthetase n=1 Tax=Mycobacterium sp. 141 TaxID=1120797 RepID=UPI00037BC988|nr:non-ribosomal peptide synthetase [Mycobacterium sp. 141]
MTTPAGTNAAELVEHLRSLGVQLWTDGANVRFRAPQNVLSPDLKAQLAAAKSEVIVQLNAETTVLRARQDRFEPFPLTDVQAAYLVGRTSAFRWGGVGCHGYGEFAVDYVVTRPAPELYGEAWRKVVDRHDMLRCEVHPDGYQTIRSDAPDGLTVRECHSADEVERERSRIAHQLRNRVYPLGKAPMYDIVVTVGPDDAVVHLSIDLLIADFVSISILMADFEKCLVDPECELPPVDFTFRDYLLNMVRERSSAIGTDRRQRDLAYWQDRLDHMPPPVTLPTLPAEEVQQASQKGTTFSRRSMRLSEAKFGALSRYAAQHGATVNVAIMSVFSRVIGRYGDRDHFLLTLTTMDRQPIVPSVAQLVGDFTGTSVLEVDVSGERTFRELLHGVGERLFDDLDHSTAGGVNVARLLGQRDEHRGEQSPVVFTSTLGAPDGFRDVGARLLHPIEGRGLSQTPQVLLDCQVSEFDGVLEVNWDTRDYTVPAEVLDSAFADFRGALESLSVDSRAWEQPLLPVRAPDVTVTGGRRAQHEPKLVHTGFLHNAVTQPAAPAIKQGDRVVSYAQLLAAASAVADELTDCGVRPHDYVGVRLPEGAAQVATILGTLLSGAAYVPIDVNWPARRVEQITSQCSLAALCDPEGKVDRLLADPSSWSAASVTTPTPSNDAVSADDTAYVIFTSGSTGVPKGVMMSHGAVVNTLTDINDRLGIGAHDAVLGVSQHTFDLSVYNMFGILAAGGTLVLADNADRANPQSWSDVITEHGVTVWNSVPAQMQLLLDHLSGSRTLPSLRRVLLSGDWIPVSQPAEIAVCAPNASILSLGGATEAAIWSVCHPVAGHEYHRSVPYGSAMRNQSVRVLTHRGELAAPWQIGEIHIGGLGLAQGYLGDPKRTEAAFVTHPVSRERLYRTGDYGRFAEDGVIEFLGRRDDQVKIHGHRIELAEVDTALCRLDGVHAAVSTVVGTGQRDRTLVAAVVADAADDEEKARRIEITEAVRCGAVQAHRNNTEDLDVQKLDRFARAARGAAIDSMCAALSTVVDVGERVPFGELAERLSLPQRLERLLRRWLDALEEAGVVVSHPGLVIELLQRRDLSACVAQWEHVRILGSAIDYGDDLLDYVGQCISDLPGLLAGTTDPLALLFPEGTLDTATAAYRDNLISRYTNGVVATAITERAKWCTPARPLRVLEVGAGVGGTTVGIVASLKGHHVRYTFTDISTFFLKQAAETFGDLDFIEYRLFDINRPHAEQGFSPVSFDVVVCANVLHNAVNIDDALAGLERLLAPGGSLVFIDATATNHPLMVSMEFKEGLHGFTDARSGSNAAFLTYAQWKSALQASPLDEVWSFPPTEHALGELGQHVFCCGTRSEARAVWPAELTERARAVLPSYMVPQQIVCLPAVPLTGNGKVDRARVGSELESIRKAFRSSGSGAVRATTALDPMQVRIGEIWVGVLDLPSVAVLSPDSDFFALGGDSLLLAQTIGRIRREIDAAAELAWDDLLRAMVSDPTLESAAVAVNRGGGRAVAADDPDAGQDPSLVYIGAGQGYTRDAEIVVCVHDGSGGLDPYKHLVEQLNFVGGQVPDIYGLRRTAGDGYSQIPPAELFATLASRYSAAITALTPVKVHLVGYCMGGLLAAEIAKCLQEAGTEVGTVTVVSSYRVPFAIEDHDILDYCFAQIMGVSPDDLGMNVDDNDIREAFAEVRSRHTAVIPEGALREAARPELAAALERSAEAGEQRMKHLAQSGALGEMWTPESLAELRAVFIHSLRAVVLGADEPFLGDIRFLRQRGDIHFLPTLKEDMTAFWREYCLGELTIADIDGNHFDCLSGENAGSVAKLLADSWAAV